ncbi:glycogen debranching protein GlgX [Actinomycetospora cinnamomea]|uniref:Glycogen operon protein n=1 Tax=Actinomycetospora cinnamomea TaxID=663609 RepID=A0A2U1FR78_9PSEU|nr:glycogen debranching protein GlgX [Actinomycetospora cinnamomea]PVZ14678.1 glycogen operon protein [Actinomycetospora cinnamomea]
MTRSPSAPPDARGARLDGDVLRVAVPATASAEAVELCLLPRGGSSSAALPLPGPDGERRVELRRTAEGWWQGEADGVAAGTPYGLRVHGPWDPVRGVRTNPAKLLVDPWTRRVAGSLTSLAAARPFAGDDPFSARRSDEDSARAVPHGLVTPAPEPATSARPDVPWPDTVIYETHVRDLTMRHPEVPEHLRGTYAGVAHPAVVDHLVALGVTTLELLPIFASQAEPSLLARGRGNHWGYSTLAYLAPHPRYASTPGREVEEVRAMVATLHAAGLEVVLDVVFNHTCEGGVDGPSLSWRGLDAAGWYALDSRGRDVDLTGCGNTLDPASPLVRALVVDSLRYWVTVMGVDGFRFDLASTLGRPRGGAFDPAAPLLTDIATDPVLSTVKLIAEPWDATGEGYRVGGFGPAWAEWNGRFRDGVRDFWRGHGPLSEIVTRLAGSSDLYWPARTPAASVNFVTAHDGFTLADLVSYERKHNEANGEQGRDGTDDNRSANHGVEGPTDDPAVLALRARQARNLLATLLLSAGTPMLLGGDELGHTQHGNNNVYSLDDETSWRSWTALPDPDLVDFVARALSLRRATPALRRTDFFYGREDTDPDGAVPDVAWLHPDGRELVEPDFHHHGRTLVVRVDGAGAGPALLVVLHADSSSVDVRLPDAYGDAAWTPVLDTGTASGAPGSAQTRPAGETIDVRGHTTLVLRAAPGA